MFELCELKVRLQSDSSSRPRRAVSNSRATLLHANTRGMLLTLSPLSSLRPITSGRPGDKESRTAMFTFGVIDWRLVFDTLSVIPPFVLMHSILCGGREDANLPAPSSPRACPI